VIVAADGRSVDRVSTLQRIVREHEPGEQVAVDVLRYGQRRSFRVRLAERPEPRTAVGDVGSRPAEVTPAAQGPLGRLGLSVEPVDDAFARSAGLKVGDRGLRVRDVARGGPAAQLVGAGTDVITDVLAPAPRRHVGTVAELERALAGAGPGSAVSLRVYGTALPAGVRVVNLQVPE
jgi:serine protease Do